MGNEPYVDSTRSGCHALTLRSSSRMRSCLRWVGAVVFSCTAATLSLAEGSKLTSGSYHAKTSYSGWVRSSESEYYKYYGSIIYGSMSQYGSLDGWARFDLGAIPDDATVTDVQLRLYQYAHSSFGSNLPGATVVLIKDVMPSAETLCSYIWSGTRISDRATCHDGWNQIPLYVLSRAAVESCLTQGYIDMGIGGGVFVNGRASGYDAPSDLKAYLNVKFSSPTEFTDLTALGASLSSFPCRSAERETVSFTVLRSGVPPPGSVMAYLNVDSATVDSQLMSDVGSGETLRANLVFQAPEEGKKLDVSCFTNLASDPIRNNDTSFFDCWVFPAYATAAVDFEPDHFPSFPPPEWAIIDRGDSCRWTRNSIIDLSAHTGRYYARCQGGSNPDDWLITGKLLPSATTADTVGLFLRSGGTPQDSVQVWALYAQNPESTLGLLLDTALAAGIWKEFRLSLDQYEGPMYVGIKRFHAGWPGIWVDDVWFSCPTGAAVAEIGDLDPSAVRFSLTPNPARGTRVQLNWVLPVSSEVRADVVDALGRRWSSDVVTSARNKGSTALRLDDMPAGTYFVRAASGAHTQTLKFVLQR
jgi:hypothetical protein